MSEPQSCGQCECCEAWRAVRDELVRDAEAVQRQFQPLLRQVATLIAERDEAQRHARDHHVEGGCVTCMAIIAERDTAEEVAHRLDHKYAQALIDRMGLRALLQKLEWSQVEHPSMGECRFCDGVQPHHERGCPLHAALEGCDGVE